MNPFIRTVANLMRTHGGDATLVVTGAPVYNYDTSEMEASEVNHTVRVLAFDFNQRMSGIVSQEGSLIQTGDKQFFIQPKDGVPAPTQGADKILFQGRKWAIISLKEVNPSGSQVIVYEAFGRA